MVRRRRRRTRWWDGILAILRDKHAITLLLALSGSAGAVKWQQGVNDTRVDHAEQRTRAVSDNASALINAMAYAIDSLDVRVSVLERENARLQRVRRNREPVTDTVYLFNADEYGPQEKPPGFLSRLLGFGR